VSGVAIGSAVWVDGIDFVMASPPDVPALVAPPDGATGVPTAPTLEVHVDDPDGGDLATWFYGRTAGSPPGSDFTLVVLPDTQHYTDADDVRAAIYRQQTQWIVDQRSALNVAFVSHLGDVTESWDGVELEWQRADAAMDILDADGVPNNVAPGNHDLGSGGTTSRYFDLYFPPSRYDLPQNGWYGGWLGEEPGQVQRLNKDNYELFTAGGIDFLILHLEVDPPLYVLAWANDIISRYPDREVIVSTHAFLDGSGTVPSNQVTARPDGTSAAEVWDQLIYPNCNVFLVVSGHYSGEARRTSDNACGLPVHQILTNYQSRTNGGDGWLRYYTFRPTLNQIDAFTYSPSLGKFRDGQQQRVLARAQHGRLGRLPAPRYSDHAGRFVGLDRLARPRECHEL